MVVNAVSNVQVNGVTRAMVVKSIPYESLENLMAINYFNGEVKIMVMDRASGQILFDTGNKGVPGLIQYFFRENVPLGENADNILKKMKNKETGSAVFLDDETHEKNYVYYMPTKSHDWIIAAYVPEKIAFADSMGILSIFIGFGAIEILILVVYLVGVTKDTIIEVEKAVLQERLIKAEKAEAAKTAFLFNMSHDIRTPMNAILGYTEIAKRHLDSMEQVGDCLDKIGVSGKHLMEIINDVLDMSRIESGHVKIEAVPMDIVKCANENVLICKSLATTKNMTLTVRTEGITNPKVYGDCSHINEVIVNILSNAIKYTPDGGTVSLSVVQGKTEGDEIQWFDFIIEDNGMGMSEEFLEHIFEAFERENNSTISGIEGTGLGMAIVKKLVNLMGGDIVISSEKNVGTTVKVSLPFELNYYEEDVDEVKEIEVRTPDAFEDRKRILLVEDNEMNREIAKAILEESGFIIEEATDGDVAVEMVKNSSIGYYSTILMDVQMPRMNGYEATKAIRSLDNKQLAGIPIIAMTANAFDEDRKKALECGMDAHVAKPIEINKLLITLNHFQ